MKQTRTLCWRYHGRPTFQWSKHGSFVEDITAGLPPSEANTDSLLKISRQAYLPVKQTRILYWRYHGRPTSQWSKHGSFVEDITAGLPPSEANTDPLLKISRQAYLPVKQTRILCWRYHGRPTSQWSKHGFFVEDITAGLTPSEATTDHLLKISRQAYLPVKQTRILCWRYHSRPTSQWSKHGFFVEDIMAGLPPSEANTDPLLKISRQAYLPVKQTRTLCWRYHGRPTSQWSKHGFFVEDITAGLPPSEANTDPLLKISRQAYLPVKQTQILCWSYHARPTSKWSKHKSLLKISRQAYLQVKQTQILCWRYHVRPTSQWSKHKSFVEDITSGLPPSEANTNPLLKISRQAYLPVKQTQILCWRYHGRPTSQWSKQKSFFEDITPGLPPNEANTNPLLKVSRQAYLPVKQTQILCWRYHARPTSQWSKHKSFVEDITPGLPPNEANTNPLLKVSRQAYLPMKQTQILCWRYHARPTSQWSKHKSFVEGITPGLPPSEANTNPLLKVSRQAYLPVKQTQILCWRYHARPTSQWSKHKSFVEDITAGLPPSEANKSFVEDITPGLPPSEANTNPLLNISLQAYLPVKQTQILCWRYHARPTSQWSKHKSFVEGITPGLPPNEANTNPLLKISRQAYLPVKQTQILCWRYHARPTSQWSKHKSFVEDITPGLPPNEANTNPLLKISRQAYLPVKQTRILCWIYHCRPTSQWSKHKSFVEDITAGLPPSEANTDPLLKISRQAYLPVKQTRTLCWRYHGRPTSQWSKHGFFVEDITAGLPPSEANTDPLLKISRQAYLPVKQTQILCWRYHARPTSQWSKHKSFVEDITPGLPPNEANTNPLLKISRQAYLPVKQTRILCWIYHCRPTSQWSKHKSFVEDITAGLPPSEANTDPLLKISRQAYLPVKQTRTLCWRYHGRPTSQWSKHGFFVEDITAGLPPSEANTDPLLKISRQAYLPVKQTQILCWSYHARPTSKWSKHKSLLKISRQAYLQVKQTQILCWRYHVRPTSQWSKHKSFVEDITSGLPPNEANTNPLLKISRQAYLPVKQTQILCWRYHGRPTSQWSKQKSFFEDITPGLPPNEANTNPLLKVSRQAYLPMKQTQILCWRYHARPTSQWSKHKSFVEDITPGLPPNEANTNPLLKVSRQAYLPMKQTQILCWRYHARPTSQWSKHKSFVEGITPGLPPNEANTNPLLKVSRQAYLPMKQTQILCWRYHARPTSQWSKHKSFVEGITPGLPPSEANTNPLLKVSRQAYLPVKQTQILCWRYHGRPTSQWSKHGSFVEYITAGLPPSEANTNPLLKVSRQAYLPVKQTQILCWRYHARPTSQWSKHKSFVEDITPGLPPSEANTDPLLNISLQAYLPVKQTQILCWRYHARPTSQWSKHKSFVEGITPGLPPNEANTNPLLKISRQAYLPVKQTQILCWRYHARPTSQWSKHKSFVEDITPGLPPNEANTNPLLKISRQAYLPVKQTRILCWIYHCRPTSQWSKHKSFVEGITPGLPPSEANTNPLLKVSRQAYLPMKQTQILCWRYHARPTSQWSKHKSFVEGITPGLPPNEANTNPLLKISRQAYLPMKQTQILCWRYHARPTSQWSKHKSFVEGITPGLPPNEANTNPLLKISRQAYLPVKQTQILCWRYHARPTSQWSKHKSFVEDITAGLPPSEANTNPLLKISRQAYLPMKQTQILCWRYHARPTSQWSKHKSFVEDITSGLPPSEANTNPFLKISRCQRMLSTGNISNMLLRCMVRRWSMSDRHAPVLLRCMVRSWSMCDSHAPVLLRCMVRSWSMSDSHVWSVVGLCVTVVHRCCSMYNNRA